MKQFCPRCKKEKPIKEFHNNLHRLLRRFHLCKQCRREKHTPRANIYKKISNNPADYVVPIIEHIRYSEILAVGIAKGELDPAEVKYDVSGLVWIEICNHLLQWKKK